MRGVLSSVMVGDIQQIVCRNMEKMAESDNILHAGLAFSALDIGNLSLGHIYGRAQSGLVQIPILPQIADFFSKRKLHRVSPRAYFTIDKNFLLILDNKCL